MIFKSTNATLFPSAEGGDDTAALQATLDSGKTLSLANNGSYTVSAPLRITRSGQQIHLNGATISANGVSTSIFVIGEDAKGRFVKTDDVFIQGPGTLRGQADGKGRQPPFAIGITAPPVKTYTPGRGCSRITIRDVRERGFCFGIIATGADNMLIENFALGGNVYYKTLEAGGYGILLQTCFQTRILHPTGVATVTDRHAIYISADPRLPFNDANTCKGVLIRDLDIDWTAVHGKGSTELEAPLAVRSAQDLSISGGVVKGGYGGMDYIADNGNGKNVIVNGVNFTGQIAGKHTRACLTITRFTGGYVTDTVTISGCTLRPSGPNMYGIALVAVNNITVSGNAGSISASIALVAISGGVTNYNESGNTWTNAGAYTHEVAGKGNAGITFGVNHDSVSRGGKLFHWITTPKALRFGYARYGEVATGGAEGPVVAHDPFAMIERVTATARGVCIQFNGTVDCPSPDRVAATASGGYIANVVVDRIAEQEVGFTVLGVKDGSLVSLPGDSHHYRIATTVSS